MRSNEAAADSLPLIAICVSESSVCSALIAPAVLDISTPESCPIP